MQPQTTRYGVSISPCSLQMVETYLGKPGLVRETSRVGMLASSMHTIRCSAALTAHFFGLKGGRVKGGDKSTRDSWPQRGLSGRARAVRAFFDVVLAPDLKEQVGATARPKTDALRTHQ